MTEANHMHTHLSTTDQDKLGGIVRALGERMADD